MGKVDAKHSLVLKRRSQHQAAALSAAAAAAAAAAAQHHDFGYSHDFSPKASPAVPTYKWMQVKRNVPKPGKEAFSESEDEGLKKFTRKGPSESAYSNVNRVLHPMVF